VTGVLGVVALTDATWALSPLAGVALVRRAVLALCAPGACDEVLVTAPRADADAVRRALTPVPGRVAVVEVEGRSTPLALGRALRTGAPSCPADLVVLHDAVQAMASGELAAAVVRTVRGAGAGCDGAVCVGPVTDTVKRVAAVGRAQEGVVLDTVDRDHLGTLRTPQAYRAALLLDLTAHLTADLEDDPRDEGSPLAEVVVTAGLARGWRLHAVAAPPDLLAVTGPLELELAEAVLSPARPGAGR